LPEVTAAPATIKLGMVDEGDIEEARSKGSGDVVRGIEVMFGTALDDAWVDERNETLLKGAAEVGAGEACVVAGSSDVGDGVAVEVTVAVIEEVAVGLGVPVVAKLDVDGTAHEKIRAARVGITEDFAVTLNMSTASLTGPTSPSPASTHENMLNISHPIHPKKKTPSQHGKCTRLKPYPMKDIPLPPAKTATP
jgi:hypothetical protein